jgi:enoyl-CoA hydratase/carnithine racemase
MINVDTGTEEPLCCIDQRVATITLNNPHKKNVLGDILTPALKQILFDLEDNDQIGCIMLTGSGDAFCFGGDVTGMGGGSSRTISTKQKRVDQLTHAQKTLTQRLHEHPKITIAALPGAAAGAGLSIALACDLRVASENAFITTAFVNIGLPGDYGNRLVGLAQAKELFYLSERINASDAMQMGIVNRLLTTPEESHRNPLKR